LNISQESPSADLTVEETKTNEEPTILLHSDTNLFIKKTTIITETTTTTTNDEDVSVPVEDSTKTLKYLVHQSALSNEANIDEEPIDNEFVDDTIAHDTSIPDNEEQNSQPLDDTTLERIDTITDTVSTGKDSESSSDFDEELLNAILDSFASYAQSLTCNILESAIHSNTIESNKYNKHDDNQQSDESSMQTNTSTNLIQSVAKDVNNDESVSDNSNQM
jgi:hypothetical protein